MDNSKVVRAITSVTCVMILVKLLAMLRNILQARLFGAGADVDAFTLANNYSHSLFTTICYALCIAAIPIFSQRLLESRQACYRAADEIVTNTVVLSLGITGILILLTGMGVMDGVGGLQEQLPLFRFCFMVMVAALPIITLTYLLLSLFQAMGHFNLQGCLSLLYNIFLCGVLLFAGDRLDLRLFAVLVSGCWLLQLAMTFPSMKKEGYRPRLHLNLKKREYWAFLRLGVMTTYNSAIFLLCYLVNARFAAQTAEAGTLSSFYYADMLYEPLTTSLIYSISIVMFPQFSQKYVQMKEDAYRQYVVLVLKNAMLYILPVSLLFWAFGTPIIRVLFEGGNFNAGDTLLCGRVFSLYSLGMVGFFLLDLLTKAYYAMGKTVLPLVFSSVVLVLCGGSNALFVWLAPDRPELLALSTSLSMLMVGIAAYIGFSRAGKISIPKKELLWGTGLSILLGMGARILYVQFFETASKGWLVLQCGCAGVVAILLYLLLMGSMIPSREILQKLRRRK